MNLMRALGTTAAACLAGAAMTSADVYEVDPAHTQVGFSVRHMGISKVSGKFKTFTGKVHFDGKDILSVKIEGVIQTKSIDTGVETRDEHLRSKDFFDVATYPEIIFSTTGVEKSADGHLLKGKMSMHGVTKEVTLPIEIAGPIDDQWGNKRIGIELTGSLDRHDFGIGSDGVSDKLIGDIVKLEINAEAIAK